MRFAVDDEEAMMAESARRLVEDTFPREVVDRFARDGVIQDRWRSLIGDSGLLAVCANPAVGGLGLGAGAALAIAEAAGSRALPFPISDGVAAAALLGSHAELAERVIAAKTIVSIAPPAVLETVMAQDGRMRLTGEIGAASWAAQAQALIVDADAPDGAPTRMLVDLSGDGVRLTPRRSIDPTTPAAGVTLQGASAERLGPADGRWTRLRTLLAAAELQGAAQRSLSLAVDYMKQRRQFGQEIGRFQALKHIAATDALEVENMALAVGYAAWAHDSGDDAAEEASHIAKAYASEAALAVAEDSIQCHGGIGFTWDYGLHFLLRRIVRLSATLGTAMEHREAVAAGLIAARTR